MDASRYKDYILPLLFVKCDLFESIEMMTGAVNTLTVNCVEGITANEDECRSYVERSVGICTALCPYIGYRKATEIAKTALKTGEPVRELVRKAGLLREVNGTRSWTPCE